MGMEAPEEHHDGRSSLDNAPDPLKELHVSLDMISCYASLMSTLRHSPEFLGTLDLLQMMEALNELLLDECRILQELLEERQT